MKNETVEAFKQFVEDYELAGGMIEDGCGNRLKVKRMISGFFKVTVINETLDVKEEEDVGS